LEIIYTAEVQDRSDVISGIRSQHKQLGKSRTSLGECKNWRRYLRAVLDRKYLRFPSNIYIKENEIIKLKGDG
jgi:hypothetical protein